MTATHTPGEWTVLDERSKRAPGVHLRIAVTAGAFGVVCRIANEVSGRPLTDEDMANAVLIARAPKLLALAHKFARECVECAGTGTLRAPATGEVEDCHFCADIHAEIRAAEGRSQ